MNEAAHLFLGPLARPTPLYSAPEKFAVIWSAKSGCTAVLLWFLHRLGKLEEARAFSGWPHDYRSQVLMQDKTYREEVRTCDVGSTRFLRVLRDPARRAVSSWASAFLIPDIDRSVRRFLKRNEADGYSFREFLDFLEAGNVDIDIHVAPQRSPVEDVAPDPFVINIDKSDLLGGLNAFEEQLGLAKTDFDADSLLKSEMQRIANSHHLRRFESEDDWSETRLTRDGVNGKWPPYAALLNPTTMAKIEGIYAEDYEAYGAYFGDDQPHQGSSGPRVSGERQTDAVQPDREPEPTPAATPAPNIKAQHDERTDAEARVRSVGRWHQKFEIVPGVWTPGAYDPGDLWNFFDLPKDMEGLRVLDVGANDGFFSAMCAERGAMVTAVDYQSKDKLGFSVTQELRGFEADFIHDNVFNLPSYGFEPFDVVLFLGVLYHLPDPYRALNTIADLCAGTVCMETLCEGEAFGDEPVMRFLPGRSENNDPTNFWSPNFACLKAMLTDVEFEVEKEWLRQRRALLRASRIRDSERTQRRYVAYSVRTK